MNTRFTELIELNQIDINLRIDDVIKKITSDIEYELTRPYASTLNYDREIIAIIEDLDIELRYAKVSILNVEKFESITGETLGSIECVLEAFENDIMKSDRNFYDESLSYEKWERFVEKLSAFGEVILLSEDTANAVNFKKYKFAIILNSEENL